MLIRLILFLALFAGAFAVFRFLKAKRLDRSGGLDVFEIERLMKIANGSQRMKQAMALRLNVVGAAPTAEKKAISAKVDGALRRLAHIEQLRQKVKKALESADRRALEGRAALLREEAAATEGERAEAKLELAAKVDTQVEQLKQLYLRDDELDEAADRVMLEMNNLHLALLNASSSEASSDTGSVANALAQLEETSEGLRQQTSAEEEVERLLKAAQAQRGQRAGG